MDIISTLKCSREHYQQKFDLPMENQEFLCQSMGTLCFSKAIAISILGLKKQA